MELFIFSTLSEEKGGKLESLAGNYLPRSQVEVYHSFDYLSKRLKQPVPFESIAVLAPATRQELRDFLPRREMLRDLRTIVILPDHEAETIAVAHQLRPRFLTFLNHEFHDLGAVLGKMITGPPPNRDQKEQ